MLATAMDQVGRRVFNLRLACWGSGRRSASRRSFLAFALSRRNGAFLASVVDFGAWIRELDVLALPGADTVADIGNKDVGAAGKGGGSIAFLAGADGDSSAVHVHLAVTKLVEPGPGEQGLTSRGISGHGELVAGIPLGWAFAYV